MSDEQMLQIQQILAAEYKKGFDAGWYDGNAAAWGALVEWATKRAESRRLTRDDVDQTSGAVDPPIETTLPEDRARRWQMSITERRLTPAEQRAVDYVRENPGVRAREIHGVGKSTLYKLAKAGVLTNLAGQFYPSKYA